jgi:sugar phosphate isomerase/epimerase
MTKEPLKLSVTMYSFNREYYNYTYSIDDILRMIGSLGEGIGLEIVPPMFDRAYPYLSLEIEHKLRSAFDKYGIVPVAYGGYSDLSRPAHRFATDDEAFEFLKVQLDAAKSLGFPVVRSGYRFSMYERLGAYCEKIGIKLTHEVHCPSKMELISPIIEICRKFPEHLGLTVDCGTMCREPSDVYYKRFRDQGVDEKYISMITDWWNKVGKQGKMPGERFDPEISEVIRDAGGDELAQLMGREATIYFVGGDPKMFLEVIPHVFHVHGKFFHIDDNLNENAVRYPEIVKALHEAGYKHYVSTEYEGHHWNADLDAWEQIERHHKLIRSIEAKL